ncbi:MAG: hypothetical protein AAGA68_24565 [Pseudomonadota bacterium]
MEARVRDPLRLQLAVSCAIREQARCAATALAALATVGLTGVALQVEAGEPVFPPEFDVSSLLPENGGDGRDGFALLQAESYDRVGVAVTSSDINGDGIDDLMVGASFGDTQDGAAAGRIYTIFGSNTGFAPSINLASLLPINGGDGSLGFVIGGFAADERAGDALGAGADVNGDGLDDLIIGAYNAEPEGQFGAGSAYVLFGRSEGFPPVVQLSDLAAENGGDGSEGVVLFPRDVGGRAGSSVQLLPDLNGDGLGEIAVGSPESDPGGRPSAGLVYIVFGAPAFAAEFELTSLLAQNGGDGSAGVVINGVNQLTRTGTAIASGGDINADGRLDLFIGAPEESPGERTEAGIGYLIFNPAPVQHGAAFELASLFPIAGGDGSEGVVIAGIEERDVAGGALSLVGDFNGDGIDDVLLGAPRASLGGDAYVVFGSDAGFPPLLELSQLTIAEGGDGSLGVVVNGFDAFQYVGNAVAGGDVNGDSIDDIVVASGGRTYVIFGQDAGFPAEIALESLSAENGGDGTLGFVIQGVGSTAGQSLSVTDLNGDGVSDIAVGQGSPFSSDAFVVFGRRLELGLEVAGAAARQLNCVNITTSQRLPAPFEGTPQSAAANCEEAGLSISSGERVLLTLGGVSVGTALQGDADRLVEAQGLCRNIGTGQTVALTIDEFGEWSCAEDGLVTQIGDRIEVRLAGQVP